jgi:hypothetical protein
MVVLVGGELLSERRPERARFLKRRVRAERTGTPSTKDEIDRGRDNARRPCCRSRSDRQAPMVDLIDAQVG